MLDVSRHYMPIEGIKRLLRGAAACGMNRLHWHLTDDQGWRLEIRSYPRLTEKGSRRGPAVFGSDDETQNNDGYYTQDEVRDVVRFADELGISIVPEIEIPGHASAMLHAYPEYGCRRTVADRTGLHTEQTPYTYDVGTIAGVFPNLICAGRDDAVNFLKGILDEVCELFPGPEVHIGGDEAIKQHWRRCPDCQKRIRQLGLKDEHDLQRWLVLQIGDYLAHKGKKTIVWNESLDGGILPDYFIVQHWLGNDADTAAFMAAGGKVISSETTYYYLSRPYPGLDVHDIWTAPAVPDYAKDHPENLIGLECPLWSERVTNPERAEYLLFPRMCAVALKAQGGGHVPPWPEFLEKVRAVNGRVAALGIAGAPEAEWVYAPEEAQRLRADIEGKRRALPEMAATWRIADGLMSQEALEKLIKAIDLPEAFALRVMDHAWARVPEFCGDVSPDTEDGVPTLAEHLLRAVYNRESGPWKGIPEDIFIATMKAFTRFVREHEASTGYCAFDRGFWTTRQADALLFRIGELEYELIERDGVKALSLHIPSDAVLTPDRLNASVDATRAFMKAYRPAWENAPMLCHSWLLSPKLKDLLPENSRILGFQRGFDVASEDPDSDDGVSWIFGLTGEQARTTPLDDYREDTTLQRAVKALMRAGGHVGEARGALVRPF